MMIAVFYNILEFGNLDWNQLKRDTFSALIELRNVVNLMKLLIHFNQRVKTSTLIPVSVPLSSGGHMKLNFRL